MNLKAIMGVEGVSELESEKARRVGHFLNYLVFGALLLVLIEMLLNYVEHYRLPFALTVLIWGLFVTELLVNLWLVRDRKRYLLHNWLSLLIIVLVFPWNGYSAGWAAVIRSLRLLLLLRVMSGLVLDVLTLLKRNKFGVVLLVYSVFVVVSGVIFAVLEDKSISDGIWYALVTVTTIGYGDVVPVTENGRLFGTVIIVFGVVLFSLVTANISAYLIGSEQKAREKDILATVKQMQIHLDQQGSQNKAHIERVLQEVETTLAEVEQRLKAHHDEHVHSGFERFEHKRDQDYADLMRQVRTEHERMLSEMRQLVKPNSTKSQR